MNAKWAITAVTVSYSVLLVLGLFALQDFYEISFQGSIDRLSQLQTQRYIEQLPGVTVTVFYQNAPLYGSASKPNIITTNATARDIRTDSFLTGSSHCLRIDGRLNNIGGGTAYNLAIHILAMHSEGVAINSNQSLGGITPYMSLGYHFTLNYTGSPITNCTVSPIYTDAPRPISTLSPTDLG
jgi:hypothetical protein